MYCKHCGKEIPETSKFCRFCGKDLGKIDNRESQKEHIEKETEAKVTSPNSSSQPYIISTGKLVILSLATFGLYEIHWFYKHFKSFKAEDDWKISPLARAIFATLFSYSLFKHVSEKVKKINADMGLNSKGLAVLYFLLIISASLGGYYWWIAILTFIPLIPAQNAINFYWKEKYNNKVEKSGFGFGNLLVFIIGGAFVLLALYGTFLPEETDSTSYIEQPATDVQTDTAPNASPQTAYNQEEIASSVVNIFCPSIIEGEDGTGGSGTILTDDGIILTNSHIIPQDEEYINVDEEGCLVILPNPITGQSEELFLAEPIVLPGISDEYDLAFMSIYDAYYDEETGEYQGSYPRTFPAFDDSNRCVDENIKLGEKITIFGYPAIGGGYSLTITEGLVSSFPGEGLIITSAKISQGNSGGLAVDERGCMIGVPSFVSSDEYESLGVLISPDIIEQFLNEVLEYLEE